MADPTHALLLEVTQVNGDYDRLWVRMAADLEERVWGGGEQFSYFVLRGRPYPIWVREQGTPKSLTKLEKKMFLL
jgi:alpha-glucosidase